MPTSRAGSEAQPRGRRLGRPARHLAAAAGRGPAARAGNRPPPASAPEHAGSPQAVLALRTDLSDAVREALPSRGRHAVHDCSWRRSRWSCRAGAARTTSRWARRSANRTRAETEGLIGYFVNMLALRADLSGDPTASRAPGSRVREVVARGLRAPGDPPGSGDRVARPPPRREPDAALPGDVRAPEQRDAGDRGGRPRALVRSTCRRRAREPRSSSCRWASPTRPRGSSGRSNTPSTCSTRRPSTASPATTAVSWRRSSPTRAGGSPGSRCFRTTSGAWSSRSGAARRSPRRTRPSSTGNSRPWPSGHPTPRPWSRSTAA